MSKHRPPQVVTPAPDLESAARRAAIRAALRETQRRLEISILDRLEALLETFPEPQPPGAP